MKKNKILLIAVFGMLALLVSTPLVYAETQSSEDGIIDRILNWFIGLFSSSPQYNEYTSVANDILNSDEGWVICEIGETYYTFCKEEDSTERQTIAYPDRINYFDDDGSDGTYGYQPIDRTLEVSNTEGYDYEVTKGYYEAQFNLSDMRVEISRDNWFASMEELGFVELNNGQYNKLTEKIANQEIIIPTKQVEKFENKMIATVNSDGMDYSLEFAYLNSRLRETVILNSEPDISANKMLGFISILDTDMNIYVNNILWNGEVITTTNEIKLVKENETIYLVEPIAYDSVGEHTVVTYVLFEQSGINYLAKFVDNSWILDNERVYPIYIDPTTSLPQSKMFIYGDTYTDASNSNTNYGDLEYVFARDFTGGAFRRAYTLLNISAFDYNITSARFNSYQFANNYVSTPVVNIKGYYCDAEFEEDTLTWSNQGDYISGCGSALPSTYDTLAYNSNGWKYFDVSTEAIAEQVTGDGVFTVKIQSDETGAVTQRYTKYYTKEQDADYMPYLSLRYKTQTGQLAGTTSYQPYTYYDNYGNYYITYTKAGATGYDIWLAETTDVNGTWNNRVILDNTASNYYPFMFRDYNDLLHVIYYDAVTTYDTFEIYSSDNGTTWSAQRNIFAGLSASGSMPYRTFNPHIEQVGSTSKYVFTMQHSTTWLYAIIFNSDTNTFSTGGQISTTNNYDNAGDLHYASDGNLYVDYTTTTVTTHTLRYSTNEGTSWNTIGNLVTGAISNINLGFVEDGGYLWLMGGRSIASGEGYARCNMSLDCTQLGNWSAFNILTTDNPSYYYSGVVGETDKISIFGQPSSTGLLYKYLDLNTLELSEPEFLYNAYGYASTPIYQSAIQDTLGNYLVSYQATSTIGYYYYDTSENPAYDFVGDPTNEIINSAVVPAEITEFEYSGNSFSVTATDNTPTGLYFTPDGTGAYIVGTQTDKVTQFALSTAWDISTASTTGTEFYVGTQDANPYSVYFKPDGTKMYMYGTSTKKVYQYSLGTAWNVSTAVYDAKSYLLTGTTPYDITFSEDGTKMYSVDISTYRVYEYDLSTAWDIFTSTYNSKYLLISAVTTSPRGIKFNQYGTEIYISSDTSDRIYQYDLSTAWDITTGVYNTKYLSVATEDAFPFSMFVNPENTKFYFVGQTNDKIYQYNATDVARAFETEYLTYQSEVWYNNSEISVNEATLHLGSREFAPDDYDYDTTGDITTVTATLERPADLVENDGDNTAVWWDWSLEYNSTDFDVFSEEEIMNTRWAYWLDNSISFSRTTNVLEYEPFTAQITLGHVTLNSSFATINSTAVFNYENTNNAMSKTTPTATTIKFSSSDRAGIPTEVTAPYPVTFTGYAYSNLGLAGLEFTRGNTSTSHSVNPFVFTISSSGAHQIFNFYIRNESTSALMIGNMNGVWFGTGDLTTYERNYSFARTGANTYTYYYYPPFANFTADSQIQYWATGYAKRDYYIEDASLNNQSVYNINLYLLLESEAERVSIHVTDQLNNPVQDALVRIEKYDIATNTYVTIASAKTDYLGLVHEYLEIGDTFYRFLVTKDGYAPYQTTEIKVTTADVYLRISLVSEEYDDISDLSQIRASLNYDVNTSTIDLSFADLTGISNQWCLEVIGENVYGGTDTQLSYECVNTTAGAIDYYVDNATAQTYEQIVAKGWLFSNNPNIEPIPKLIISGTWALKTAIFGNTGLFIALLLIILCALIGLFNPTVSVVLTMFGVVASYYLKLLSISTGAVVGIIAVGVFIIYKMRT